MHSQQQVSRTLDAPAARAFALLADPDRHPDLDGSGQVRGSLTHHVITEVGARFRMAMHRPGRGDYETDNIVTTFEPDRAIGWATTYPDHEPLGFTWTYRLEPDGDDRTTVTHVHDWSGVIDPELRPVFPRVPKEGMEQTLENLAAALR